MKKSVRALRNEEMKRFRNALHDVGSRPHQGTSLLLGDRSASCRTVEKLLTFSCSSISGDVESRLGNRGGKEECSNLFEQQTKLLR